MERPNFEGKITSEGDKAPFRRIIEREQKEIMKLKSVAGRWAGLAAWNLSESILDD